MIGRYKPAQRFAPLRPRTLAEHMAQQERRAERRAKVLRKRRELGMGPTRTIVEAQLNHITSLFVRRRDQKLFAGYCLICVVKHQLGIARFEKQPIQCAYHIVPRGDDGVKWNLGGIVGACHRCNDGERWSRTTASRRDLYRRIHVALIGETQMARLEALALSVVKFSTAELIALRDERKAQLEGR